jgi:hypothetical protein
MRIFEMLKLKNSAMLVVAALCGYLALMTPDWKSDLVASIGSAYGEGDINGDAIPELTFRNETTKEYRSWTMYGDVPTQVDLYNGLPAYSFFPQYNLDNDNWKVIAQGDVDGDGDTDFIFRNVASGYNRAWIMNKRPNGKEVYRVTLTFFPQFGSTEQNVVMGDFSGDGIEDLLFHNETTGATRIWVMDSTGNRSTVTFPGSQTVGFEIQGVGDFDNDGDADIFWRNNSTGDNSIWRMASNLKDGASLTPPALVGSAWHVVGAGDLNEDGTDDLLWNYTGQTGQKIWSMSAGTYGSEIIPPAAPTGENFSGIMDMNGDGNQDILYYNPTTGRARVWTMVNFVRTAQGTTSVFGAGGAWRLTNDVDF